ncbi:PREDICTED: plasma kallikrein-like, partial [Cyprinodon variegatus]|uniref:plasma kallikrein-like n=1 Tax=Cyprinodon variegatus TaxID=28743 RepID=UPI00074283C2
MEKYSILVGLLIASSFSFIEGCRDGLLENIDFPGTDITFLYSPSVEHCQRLCTEHHSCLFFTFVRPDWTRDNRHFYCYLKTTPSGDPASQIPLQGVTSGFSLKNCIFPARPCFSQVFQNVDFLGADYRALFTPDYQECQRVCTKDPGCQFFTFLSVDYSNQDLRLKSVSPEHCQVLCSANPQCTYFSFSSVDFSCYLKNNLSGLTATPKKGTTSGIPARFCQLDDNWVKQLYQGVDFRGSD